MPPHIIFGRDVKVIEREQPYCNVPKEEFFEDTNYLSADKSQFVSFEASKRSSEGYPYPLCASVREQRSCRKSTVSFAELHFGRMQHGEFAIGIEGVLGGISSNISTPSRDHPWRLETSLLAHARFLRRLYRELFSHTHAFKKELECESSLARAGSSLVEIHPIGIKSPF